MEYWGNALEGRGLLFYDNIELQVDDDISSPRKSVNGWDLKSPSDFDKNMLNPNPKTVDNLEFTDSGFPEIITNSLSSDPSLGCLAAEISDDSSNTVSSLLGELEFGSRVSSSVMKSSNRKSSSLVDLRLRGLADSGEINNHKSSKGSPVLSPVGFSSPAKRARTENLYSQVHVCQVHGCDKDLSSSKDYYKRHKVCDVHSKASKVFVKGVEQRFCQQCSRFHLLAEFDDGKRSCRKRLAGHNERRRKSHMGTCSGKSHKLPQYSQGSTRFLGTSIQQGTTFVFPEMLRGGFLRAEGYGHDNGCKRSKLEGPTYSPQVSVPISKGQSSPKSIFHLHGKGKQYSSSIFTSETEPPVLNMASTVQELSCISNTSRALYLLSAQWRNLSRHSASIPMAVPLIMQGAHHPHRYLDQSSANGFHSSGTYSMMGVDQVGTHMVPNAGVDVDLEVRADGISQSLESINAGATVDLHQLSSHLQRVEQQKNSMLVKPENDIFCCFPSACGV